MVVIDGDESRGLIPMLTLAIIHMILYLELLGFDVWKTVTQSYILPSVDCDDDLTW